MRTAIRNALSIAAIIALGWTPAVAADAIEAQAEAPAVEAARPALDAATQAKARRAIDRGIAYLRSQQMESGAYMDNVGITSLVVRVMAESPRAYREHSGPFMSKAIDYLLASQNPDGSIHRGQLHNYNTAMAAMALASLDSPKYAEAMEKARKFLKGMQLTEAQGYDKERHATYGGIGYGSGQEPDLSNTQLWAEAMKALGLPEDDPAWQKVALFVTRTIQDPEVNDLVDFKGLKAAVGTSGGAIYQPDNSPAGRDDLPDGRQAWRAYGSMTYAAMKTLIFAGIPADDERIKSLQSWVGRNYTLDENPGMGRQGYYYYFATIPKALDLVGLRTIRDQLGIEHDWRKQLIDKIVEQQREDGSWINTEARWWEDQPVLVTGYSVLSLIEALEGAK